MDIINIDKNCSFNYRTTEGNNIYFFVKWSLMTSVTGIEYKPTFHHVMGKIQ